MSSFTELLIQATLLITLAPAILFCLVAIALIGGWFWFLAVKAGKRIKHKVERAQRARSRRAGSYARQSQYTAGFFLLILLMLILASQTL